MTRPKQWLYPLVESLGLSLPSSQSMTIGSATVPMSDSVKNVGVTLDCHLTMKTNDFYFILFLIKFVRLANCELRRISSIRHLLSTDATKILVSAFALSRLDYRSSLLSGCPQYLLNYKKNFNNAARLVLRVSKTDHISPRLVSVHLIHEYRTDSLLFVYIDMYHVSAPGVDERMINVHYYYSLYYNCLTLNASVYMTKLETVYKPTRQLRSSSDTSILCLTSVHTHSLGHKPMASNGGSESERPKNNSNMHICCVSRPASRSSLLTTWSLTAMLMAVIWLHPHGDAT